MEIAVDSIPGAFESREGLPRPNWEVIGEWVDAKISEVNLDSAWVEIAHQWLEVLRDALPRGYCVTESTEFYLLSHKDDPIASRILDSCEYLRARILEKLPGVAQEAGFGKHVVLAFPDQQTYYDYVADFYPDEGAFGGSGGMFLSQGYGHFVFWTIDHWDFERTIAHEMTHNLLCHLPLPLWLNEGVTQVIEDAVLESSSFHVDHELVRQHRAYWSSATIDAFWSGDSFHDPDEGQELSYHLADVLVRNILSDFPGTLLEFLRKANQADAGESASLQVFKVSLSDRVAQFLGPGGWSPRADYDLIDPAPASHL